MQLREFDSFSMSPHSTALKADVPHCYCYITLR